MLSCQSIQQKPVYAPHRKDPAYEEVSFSGINGYLFRPKGKGPFPAIVALHGCSGLFRRDGNFSPRDLDWGKRLSSNGFVVLYPDSFTNRNIDEICSKKDLISMPKDLRRPDTFHALAWLASQNYVKQKNIGIMGWSNGGSTLLWTIDKNLAPVDDVKNTFKYAIAFYPGCYTVNKDKDWAPSTSTNILMGELDDWCSPKPCLALAKKFNKKVHVTLYADSYHDFDAPNMPPTEMHHLAYTAKGDSAMIGTNEIARKQAIEKVMDILKTNSRN